MADTFLIPAFFADCASSMKTVKVSIPLFLSAAARRFSRVSIAANLLGYLNCRLFLLETTIFKLVAISVSLMIAEEGSNYKGWSGWCFGESNTNLNIILFIYNVFCRWMHRTPGSFLGRGERD